MKMIYRTNPAAHGHCRETPALISDPSCVAERPVLDEETNIPALEYQYKSMLASVIAVDDMVVTLCKVWTRSESWKIQS